MSDRSTDNRDPYKGFVDINIEGVDEIIDKVWGNVPTSGIKAMNIKGFGCIAVRWSGGENGRKVVHAALPLGAHRSSAPWLFQYRLMLADLRLAAYR